MSKKYLVLSAVIAVVFLGVVTYASIVSSDSQVFTNADKNGDGVLDKKEFMNYIKLTQTEKQKKSGQKGVRICPRTGEVCEENCSGDGDGCCKEGKGAAKAGCCKEGKEAAKAGCCKEGKEAAKAGCCKEGKEAAKAGCCKEGKKAAKAGCCKEGKEAAKAGCCKEGKGAAIAGCCKEGKLNSNTANTTGSATTVIADAKKAVPSSDTKSVAEKTAPAAK